MSKRKSITLLSIISVVVAFLLVMTFIRFPIGVKNYNSVLGAIDLDYDIEGGTAYTLSLASDNEEEVEDIDEVIKTLEYRLDALGYNLYSVKAIKSTEAGVKDYDIRIETKSTSTLSSDIEVVAAHGEVKLFGGTSANPTEEILTDIEAIADSQYLGSVSDGESTYYQVSITFTQKGYDGLVDLMHTAAESEEGGSSYYLEIKLGDNVLLSGSNPISETDFTDNTLNLYIQSEIGAKQIALQIRTGGLAYQYEISDAQSISSPYGSNVATLSAIIIGALVLVIMIALVVAFRGLGVIGALSMLLFIIIETLMLIAVPGIVLSMGGVVGIAVSTVLSGFGIAYAMNNVTVEYANSEKTVKAAIKKGYRMSVIPTVNAGVVSAVISILLLAFTSGLVKNFAITFGIGTGVGLIATLLFTRMYTSLILPLAKNKEKFLNLKREEA